MRFEIIKNFVDSEKLKQLNKDFDKLKYNDCQRIPYKKGMFYGIFDNLDLNFKNLEIFMHKDNQNIGTTNTEPHFDYDRKLKYYLCVNDMGERNGCFKVCIEKSHLVDELRVVNRRLNTFTIGHEYFNGKYEIKISEMDPVRAEAGDLIIFDTNVIHCGGDSFTPGTERRVLRLHCW